MKSLIKQPSAWMPLVMSFSALLLVLVHIAIFGIVRETDEGTTAHIFQLLMAGQVPIVTYFAIKWLPRTPKPALWVLTLQFLASIAALAPVFLLKL